ncbi:MAG TPA: transketolase [Acetobacteraceae bacterium]|nr:transketolase [Acetobacteraceae bacterium]
MEETAQIRAGHPALALQSAILARPVTPDRRLADAVRALAIDAVESAKSGHAGMPMGMADVAACLWTRFLKYDAADPCWPDRDRFVLSAGHGSALLYALLHLTGQEGMGSAELRRFRQLHSPAAGHPEFGAHPAIEATTGPLGQGLASAVGMAIAERLLAARFGRSLVDHRTWVIASDGDLMEGLSHEAAALAGHLRLERLAVLWDDNGVCHDGATALACSADQCRRFASYGWAVKRIDGHDPAEIAAALSFALRSRKPTLIACRTIIGFAAPTKAGTHAANGAPLGPGEAQAAKDALDWGHLPFEVPEEIAIRWRGAGTRGAGARRAWLKRIARHPMRAEFERVVAGRLPEAWHEALAGLKARLLETRPRIATRAASRMALEALLPVIPELTGGSADLARATQTLPDGIAAVAPGGFSGRFLHYGVRQHAMAAAMTGMALHGGVIPYGGSFLVYSDSMRPALRLAAQMRQRVIHILTHDSIGLGEDGAACQPIEQLAALRAMPNLCVFRPADPIETAESWELALRRTDGPSLLCLTRQSVPPLRVAASGENACARGGYVLAEADGPRQATLVASGSEVSVAMAAREMLAAACIPVAVVSLPCWELFAAQDADWRDQVLGQAPRCGIEAACGFGWERWLGADGCFIGMDGFGASGRAEDLFRHFGITPEAVVAAVRKLLAA